MITGRETNHNGHTHTTTPTPTAFEDRQRVVFFGNMVPSTCQRCNAYGTTSRGHKFCAQVTCPIALKEMKRRQRKRTSALEKVYIPRKRRQMSAETGK